MIDKLNPGKNAYTRQKTVAEFIAAFTAGEMGEAMEGWLKSLEEGLDRSGQKTFQPGMYEPALRRYMRFNGPQLDGSYTKDNNISSLKLGILLPGNMEDSMPPILKANYERAREQHIGEEWVNAVRRIFLERGGPLLTASFPFYALLLRLDSPEKAEALRQACLQKKPSNRKSSPEENIHVITLTPQEYAQLQRTPQSQMGGPC